VGLSVKIVFASIPSQEEEINDLVRHIYSNIFPNYFSDAEIKEFIQIKVLHTSTHYFNDINTLKEAFQVMASLQTIISILESEELDDCYSMIFSKNVSTLLKFSLFFPFDFEQFVEAKSKKKYIFSVYTKAANELLI
jgi:hypothetical protein